MTGTTLPKAVSLFATVIGGPTHAPDATAEMQVAFSTVIA
ncbi:hypothetical protein B0G57_10229 [Trinickia symbiotica]|nr:hypothetical protein B0G57_10229 [Trinickia symbiotica]